MYRWALAFLILAIISGVLGFFAVAGVAAVIDLPEFHAPV